MHTDMHTGRQCTTDKHLKKDKETVDKKKWNSA